jgi:acyl-CoA reductase-like NAD-dependent aldehyde dehydrogenase
MSGDRILVHESIAEDFAAKFTAKVAGLAAAIPPTLTRSSAR